MTTLRPHSGPKTGRYFIFSSVVCNSHYNKVMIRKVVKIGNSLYVIIPTSQVRALRLKVGDEVEVSIRKATPRAEKNHTKK